MDRFDIVRLEASENRTCMTGHGLKRGNACPSTAKYLLNGTPICAPHLWSKIRNLFAAMHPQRRKVTMISIEAVRS